VDKSEIKNFVLITIFEACCDAYFDSIAARYIVELTLTVYLTDIHDKLVWNMLHYAYDWEHCNSATLEHLD